VCFLVLVVEAAGLAPKDGRGLNNPYAKIVLGERRVKTEVKPETNNPTWNESFVLYVFFPFALRLLLIVGQFLADLCSRFPRFRNSCEYCFFRS